MTTNPQYLYYNETDGAWQPITLEELATIDNPELPICPLNADGTPGPQTTYAAISNRAIARATLSADKAPAQDIWHRRVNLSACLPFLRRLNTEQNINYTLNYIRAIINLSIVSGCIVAVSGMRLFSNRPTPLALSIFLGILLGMIIIFILQLFTKPTSKQ